MALPVLLRFRLLVLLAHGATVLITWPLWTVHERPPMLPALSWLPAVDVAVPLLLTIAAQVRWPRAGLVTYAVVFLYACACDETRIQPQFVSFAFLAIATWPQPGAQFLGRVHVVALWLWAGGLKLLSPLFLYALAPLLVRQVWPGAPEPIQAVCGVLLAVGEFALALFVLSPVTRRWAWLAAFATHVGILSTLAAGRNENASIWPWNFTLALCGAALFVPWERSWLDDWRAQRRAVKALALTLVLFPVGWHFGLTDAYLSFHLYSMDVPIPDAPRKPFRQTWEHLHVPIPPEHRLFQRLFDATCQPGELMTVKESRLLFEGVTTRRCPRGPANGE